MRTEHSPTERITQTPDTQPGNYYVTMRDDAGRTALLAGPFTNNHTGALAMVEAAKAAAINCNPWYYFNSFGTARFDTDNTGVLNTELGL